MRSMLALRVSEHEQRFELLADLGAMIAGEVELDDLLATFADRVARALGADRATLWLIDGAHGRSLGTTWRSTHRERWERWPGACPSPFEAGLAWV